MKLQGEFRLRLRHLEKSLLQALNDSSGSILDDDKVIGTLEVLKKEAAEITRKVEDTDTVMKEVETITAEYLPLAQACSGIYFTFEQLSTINHFYQFSLDYFLSIFDFVLHRNPNLKGVTDPQTRKEILLNELFLTSFRRTSRSLLHTDHLVLAVSLARLRMRGDLGVTVGEELDAVLEMPSSNKLELSVDQRRMLDSHLGADVAKTLVDHMTSHSSEWEQFMALSEAETCVPAPWPKQDSELQRCAWS